jgi:hypothetical protein
MPDKTKIVLTDSENMVVALAADRLSSEISGMRQVGGGFVKLERLDGQPVYVAIDKILYYEAE